MNTRRVIDDSSELVSLCTSFNSDSSNFVVGHELGFSVYGSDDCSLKAMRGKFRHHSRKGHADGLVELGTGIVNAELLGQTNFLVLVGDGRNSKFGREMVIVWDDAKQKIIFSLQFKLPVLRARLSRANIVVALQNSVHLFAFSSPPKKVSEFETAENRQGLCCIADSIVVFPGRTPGQVQIVETSKGSVSIIPAHSTPLRALTLSSDGEILATASETGTLVRVFSTRNCSRLAEFRRGVDAASVFSIALSPDKSLLAVTSDKSTLHIFSLLPSTVLTGQDKRSSQQGLASKKVSGASETGSSDHKWGIFSKLPFLPRLFSDSYSLASARFEIGGIDDSTVKPKTDDGMSLSPPRVGHPYRGSAGWIDGDTILLVGVGSSGRWERFIIDFSNDGKLRCTRNGWKRYMEF